MLGEQEHLVPRRRLGVDDAGQRLVVDDHEVGGIGASRPVLGDDGNHRLADIAHGADGDERPAHHVGERRVGVRGKPEVGDVVGGVDAEHSGCGPRRGGVDRGDPGVGVRRAHVGEPRRPGKVEVFDVRAAHRQQAWVLEPLDPGAENAPHRCDHRFRA